MTETSNTMEPLGPIGHSLDLVGMVEDGSTAKPTSATQYAVLTPSEGRLLFGDQEWVRSGKALADFPAGSVIQRRTITIAYGDWGDL